MKRFLLAIVLTALAAGAAHTRVKTTQPYLSTNAITVPVITISTDTTAVPTGIPDNAISLRGFHKRASESKEPFFVPNHPNNLNHELHHPGLENFPRAAGRAGVHLGNQEKRGTV